MTMAAVPSAPTAARVRRSPVDRYDQRREQLAESALKTLGELGYARTSLRDIATNSPFSHGVLHYYFADKLDLIDYCVRYYKAKCVTRYDALIADSTSATRARASGADPMRYLEANDAWSFFNRLGDLVRTGATNTNVGDVQVALIGPADG